MRIDQLSIAAASAAIFAVLLMRSLVPPRRSLAPRLEPYTAFGRSRLGTSSGSAALGRLVIDDGSRTAIRGLFGPALGDMASRLSRLVDAADSDTLEQRLRQAGDACPDVSQYRMRQLAAAVAGCFTGAVLGAVLFGVGLGSLVMFVCFAIAGLSIRRGALDRAISGRCTLMRTEVPAVAQLLAVHLRAGHGPVESVRSVVMRGSGPIADDLGLALGLVAGGMTPQSAYEGLAEDSAEPAATRLYRLLASSVRTGTDIVESLLAIADETRAHQRDALARRSVKRRTAMIVPLLVLVAPVMVLFVAAALPSLVFGQN